MAYLIYMQKTSTQLSKVPQKINFLHKGSKRGGGRGGEVQRFFEKCLKKCNITGDLRLIYSIYPYYWPPSISPSSNWIFILILVHKIITFIPNENWYKKYSPPIISVGIFPSGEQVDIFVPDPRNSSKNNGNNDDNDDSGNNDDRVVMMMLSTSTSCWFERYLCAGPKKQF